MKMERQIDVFFISANPAKRIVQYKLTVPKLGVIDDLCQAVSELTGVSHDHMIVTDVYNHRFHKVYNIKDSLSHILDRDDIFVYESSVTTQDDPQFAVVPVYWREKPNLGSRSCTNIQCNLFGHPIFIPVARKGFTSRTLYNAIIERTKRYVRQPPRATLFSFSIVNSYGSTDIDTLPINDKPFTLSSLTYIAADWSTKMKEAYFDAKEAEELDKHDSLRKPSLIKKQVIATSQYQNLSSQYRSLFLSPDFSDVVIQIGSEEIPAHKNILAARVPFYKRLFNSGMREAVSNRIKVDPSEEQCFKEVLEYIYCGQFPSDLETDPMKYLPIADMKEIEELKIACTEAMTKLLKLDNFVEFVVAAHLYRCSDLKEKCLARLREWRATGSFSLTAADLDPLKAHPDLLVELIR